MKALKLILASKSNKKNAPNVSLEDLVCHVSSEEDITYSYVVSCTSGCITTKGRFKGSTKIDLSDLRAGELYCLKIFNLENENIYKIKAEVKSSDD